MKSSQPHANAPTERQNAVPMGKASRRATSVELSLNPIQSRTWLHRSQSFQNVTPGTQNTYLASFRKMAGLSESAPDPGGPSEPARFLLQAQKSEVTVRSIISARTSSDPQTPGDGFVPQNGGVCRTPHRPSTKPEPARLVPYSQAKTPKKTRERQRDHGASAPLGGCDGPMPTPSHCPPRIHSRLRSAKTSIPRVLPALPYDRLAWKPKASGRSPRLRVCPRRI